VRTEEQDAAAARQAEQLARDDQQTAERRWLNAPTVLSLRQLDK
jgi:hypothetical protein